MEPKIGLRPEEGPIDMRYPLTPAEGSPERKARKGSPRYGLDPAGRVYRAGIRHPKKEDTRKRAQEEEPQRWLRTRRAIF